ncbi:unnamed protein product [Linum trigynum]|uniref:Uncharacterized protein n=1 Tax=Linum trigynum TaxID=586398 RepID=A0AAV2GAA5_9ROSI
MLSTALSENPAPAPSLFPSDRPPDSALTLSTDSSPASVLTPPPTTSTSDMLIDITTIAAPPIPQMNVNMSAPENQANGNQSLTPSETVTTQPRFSYAGAVTG